MANIDDQNPEDLLNAIAGAGELVNGQTSNTSSLQNLPASALNGMLGMAYQGVDNNVLIRGRKPATAANALNDTAETPERAKDRLKDIIRITQASGGLPVTPEHREVLESAMYMAGYNVTFDDRFDGDEKQQFTQFADAFAAHEESLSGTLAAKQEGDTQIAAETQAAAERAAATEAELAGYNEQLKAGLVFAGYLDPNKAHDPEAVVFAMHDLLNENRESLDLHTEINKSFDLNNNFAPTKDSVEIMNRLTEGQVNVQRFDQFFTSTNEFDSKMVQTYMDMHGMKDWEAGNALANGKLEIPKGILQDNGELDYGQMLIATVHGTLPLPNTPEGVAKVLTPEELETYKALPLQAERTPADFMSREQYLATTLTDGDMSRYQQYLDSENAIRVPEPKPAFVPQIIGLQDDMGANVVTGDATAPVTNDDAGLYLATQGTSLEEDKLAPTQVDAATQAVQNTFQLDLTSETMKPLVASLKGEFAAANTATVTAVPVPAPVQDPVMALLNPEPKKYAPGELEKELLALSGKQNEDATGINQAQVRVLQDVLQTQSGSFNAAINPSPFSVSKPF